MTETLHMLARRAKRWAGGLRNAPLVCLTVTVSLALEAFGWGYIFLTNDETAHILTVTIPMALIEATIISASGMLALVAAFVAAERRQDPRPEQRRRAGGAQILAVVLLIPPAIKAAESWAWSSQVRLSHAYAASEQHSVDLENARDMNLDSMARREAASALAQATVPQRARIDGEFFAALLAACFLYGANMLSASALWRAKPETPAERERRERRERREERHQLRMLEAQAAVQANRPKWFRGLWTREAA